MSSTAQLQLLLPPVPNPAAPVLFDHPTRTRAVLWSAYLISKFANGAWTQELQRHYLVSLPDIAARLQQVCKDGGNVTLPHLSPTDAFHIFGQRLCLSPYELLSANITFDDLQDGDRHFLWNNALGLLYHIRGAAGTNRDRLKLFAFPWRVREEFRSHVVYRKLPWRLEPIADHFAHVSSEEDGLIAYTSNARKGDADIQTRIKPGRYLTKFYPHIPAQEIATLAAMVAATANTLKFAATADDIEVVYASGPPSCMAAGHHRCSISPVRAYGDSDLQVAYLDYDGSIIARAVVWPEKKVYGRPYGDISRLAAKLKEAGYKPGGEWCFEGARIRRIDYKPTPSERSRYRRHVLVPHIDDHAYCRNSGGFGPQFEVLDKYLRINRNGPLCGGRGWVRIE